MNLDIALFSSFSMRGLPPILAFGVNDASDVILNGGVNISQWTSDAWSKTWDAALSGGLYRALCNLGILIALVCLMMFVVQFARKWLEFGSGGDWVVAELFIPVLVIMLLTNNGAQLAALSKGLRDIISYYNKQILTVTAADVDFNKTVAGLGDHSALRTRIEELRSNCNDLIDNARLQSCLENAELQAQDAIAEYRSAHPELPEWAQDLTDYAKTAFSDPLTALKTTASTTTEVVTKGASLQAMAATAVGNLALAGLIEIVLLGCMAAFQNMIEVSMLLTALIGPIAVGASLLPFGAKPMYAWMTGFFCLGMCKLSYNIIVGLVAVTLTDAGPLSSGRLVVALVLGLFSPILAMSIAAGGGMAVFSGITSAASSVVSYAVRKF